MNDCNVKEYIIVLGWVEDLIGKEKTSAYLWQCTSFPFGPPNQNNLAEALSLAAGEVSWDYVMEKADRELAEAMAAYYASDEFKNYERNPNDKAKNVDG